MRPQLRGRDEVLGQLAVEGDDLADEVGDGLVQGVERPGRPAQHPLRELEASRVSEQPGAGLDPDAQPVVAQQPSGVGVVGRHGRFAVDRQLGSARR